MRLLSRHGEGAARARPPLQSGRTSAHPIDLRRAAPYTTALSPQAGPAFLKTSAMKVRSSLKTLKVRHRDCKLVRRKGRLYVINKTNPRFKARQG